MTFVIAKVTVPANVAQNGTVTFPYPAFQGLPTNAGSFAGGFQHQAFLEGNQALLVFGKGFGLTFNAGNITFTYLGTVPIPANTVVALQLDFVGANSLSPYQANVNRGVALSIARLGFGAPALGVATAVVNAAPVTVTTPVALPAAYVVDVPRTLTYVSSGAGDTTQTLTVRGFDEFGVAMSEAVVLNGTAAVLGKKAFTKVTGYQLSAVAAGNVSIGTGNTFGMSFVLERKNYVLKEIVDDTVPGTAGVFVVADYTVATGVTGDVRGTYTPNTLPNGVHIYELIVANPDPATVGGVGQA